MGLPLRTNDVDMNDSAGAHLIVQISWAARKDSSARVLNGLWPRIGHFHEQLESLPIATGNHGKYRPEETRRVGQITSISVRALGDMQCPHP